MAGTALKESKDAASNSLAVTITAVIGTGLPAGFLSHTSLESAARSRHLHLMLPLLLPLGRVAAFVMEFFDVSRCCYFRDVLLHVLGCSPMFLLKHLRGIILPVREEQGLVSCTPWKILEDSGRRVLQKVRGKNSFRLGSNIDYAINLFFRFRRRKP